MEVRFLFTPFFYLILLRHFHKLRGPIDSHMFSPIYSSLITSGLERGVL